MAKEQKASVPEAVLKLQISWQDGAATLVGVLEGNGQKVNFQHEGQTAHRFGKTFVRMLKKGAPGGGKISPASILK